MSSDFFNPWSLLNKVVELKPTKRPPWYQRMGFEILGRLVVILFIPVLAVILLACSALPGRAIDKFFSVLYWVASLYLKIKHK